MGGGLVQRWVLTAVGAVAGFAFWLLVEVADRRIIEDERVLLLLGAFLATGFGGVLAMAGAIGAVRAAVRALPLAGVVTGLVGLSLMRWPGGEAGSALDGFFGTPMPTLAAFAVAVLPVPFLLAQAGPGQSWRDYPALFAQTWGIVVRGAVAMAFTGIVWGVIFLSDQLLQVVGVQIIGRLLDLPPVPLLITGGVFGLAVAVVNELVGGMGPRLVLRLLRLLVPVVFGVSVIFAASVLIWGFAATGPWVSPAVTLLCMAAAGITLVTVVLDESEAEASRSPVLVQSARGMAVLLPVLAGLGVWALWQRVGDYGWTPERLFLGVLLALAVGYGLAYAGAVVRGGGWQARVRVVNPIAAVAVIAVAALWLTPVLDAERISARDQVARYEGGLTKGDALDAFALEGWGAAGAAALTEIRALAEARGDAAAIARLDDPGAAMPVADLSAMRARVVAALPVQPASATGVRDVMLGKMQDYELQQILDACAVKTGGRPGCVLVVADLVPSLPGEEAVLALDNGGWATVEGIYLHPDGWTARVSLRTVAGVYPQTEEVRALIAAWQAAPPPLAPAPVMQIGTGDEGLFFLP